MDLQQAIRSRRAVRAFTPERPVAPIILGHPQGALPPVTRKPSEIRCIGAAPQ